MIFKFINEPGEPSRFDAHPRIARGSAAERALSHTSTQGCGVCKCLTWLDNSVNSILFGSNEGNEGETRKRFDR
jgi:hypothetical protein